MAITVCEYNGVILWNVQIVNVDQQVQYDASNTDQLFVQTTLFVRGTVFHGNIIDATRPHVFTQADKGDRKVNIPANPRNAKKTDLYPQELVAYLSEPRHTLRVYIMDAQGNILRELFVVYPATEKCEQTTLTDVAGGPKPLGASITHMDRWGYEVDFKISFATQPRMPGGEFQPDQPIQWALNNRWRVRESLDQNFFMTKTYEGTIRIAQATRAYQWMARFLAFPQLEPGFRRDSCEYAVSADGLEIQYLIVDKQEAHAPPWPCTRMEVTHSESLTRFGYYVQSSCQVRLWGPPGVPKAFLLARLAQILRNRLLWDGEFGKSAFLESFRIVDYIGPENTVFGEMVINRFPNGLFEDLENDPGVAEEDRKNDQIKRRLFPIIFGPGGAIIAAVPWFWAKPKQPGNALNPPPPNDWFQKLTRNVLGTDLELPPLGENNLGQRVGVWAVEFTYGAQFQNYWQHMRPQPGGYTVGGAIRPAIVSLFFACYYQRPEDWPHQFHPPGRDRDWCQGGDGGGGGGGDAPAPQPGPQNPGPQQIPPEAVPPPDRDGAILVDAPPAIPREVARISSGGLGSEESPDLTAPAHAAALYTHATLMNDYDYDLGRAAFARSITGHYGDPLNSDDGEDDVEIISVSRPVLYRRISYEAERIGAWPEIPWPGDYDLPNKGKAKLIRCRIQPLAPTLAADGVHLIYRVHALYEWAITRVHACGTFDVATLPHVRSDAVIPFEIASNASASLLLNYGREADSYAEETA